MKRYQKFTLGGVQVPHTTIRGLQLAIQHKTQKDGVYVGITPCGNKHTWELVTKIHTAAGRTVRKAKIGKGSAIPNTKAKLLKVERV